MIAPISTGVATGASFKHSPALIQAAQNAAASQHGLINLLRLVKSLEAQQSAREVDGDGLGDGAEARKNWDTVQYAKLVLSSIRENNEQSSTTLHTLSSLDKTLDALDSRFSESAEILTPPLVRPTLIPLSSSPVNAISTPAPVSASASTVPQIPAAGAVPIRLPTPPTPKAPPPDPAPSSVLRSRRKGPNITPEWLASREKETQTDKDLLPLKSVVKPKEKGPSDRDRLLGVGIGTGMGSSQLHEELGGQLADMSHRLKLNAMHFASSLEEEKSLLDSSTDVLERNLVATRSSKKQLGAVSKKGRGTTCMTLGIVLLVMVLFVWTYMLIRFT